jgi:hypothetical protein
MSQKINATLTCSKCNTKTEIVLFRSIWGEKPENRELVFSDKINRITCPECHFVHFPATSLWYTNCDFYFSVWYEPRPDPTIDADAARWGDLMRSRGPGGTYLISPPRVRDWEAFKALIQKYETGELKTDSRLFREGAKQNAAQKGGSGCVSVLAIAIAVTVVPILVAAAL